MKKKIDKVFETFDKGFKMMDEVFNEGGKIIDDVFNKGMNYTESKPVKNYQKYVITKIGYNKETGEAVTYYLTKDKKWYPAIIRANSNFPNAQVEFHDNYLDAQNIVVDLCDNGHSGYFNILEIFTK